MACFATPPILSSAKRTGAPSSFSSGSTTGLNDMDGTRSPLGRSKCANSTTLAPWSRSLAMVGSAARSRVSSLTRPSCMGTLKSTRTSAVLPAAWASSRVRNAISARSEHRFFEV